MGRMRLRPRAMTITDLHSHRVSDNAIVNIDYRGDIPEKILFSAGIHPWDTYCKPDLGLLRATLSHPQAMAIGECGLDKLKGADIHRQIEIFEQHINMSEEMGKPLIIHCVRAHQLLIDMHRTVRPRQPWIFHGFRLKPSIAEAMLKEDILMSFGEIFNSESLRLIPDEKLLIETDASPLTIEQVADIIEKDTRFSSSDILDLSAANIKRILISTFAP